MSSGIFFLTRRSARYRSVTTPITDTGPHRSRGEEDQMETALIPRRYFLLLWRGAVLILLVASTFRTAQPQSPTGDLKFTIALQKSTFKPGEPVVLQMKLENASDQTIVINTRFLVN